MSQQELEDVPDESRVARGPMTRHRRTSIVELVQQHGSMRVDVLAERFGVSEVTIRSDLLLLEKEGSLVRDRGGAVTVSQLTHLEGLHKRASLSTAEKQRIGQAAARMVQPGDTVILDAGTTVIEMVPFLHGVANLTVVTNGVNVVNELLKLPDVTIIQLGGWVNRESASAVGAIAEQTLSGLVVQKLFLGAQAFDAKFGLTDTTMEIAQVKRAMIKASRRCILLSDSSKYGHAGLIKVVPLSEVDTLITDSELPEDVRLELEQECDEVILV